MDYPYYLQHPGHHGRREFRNEITIDSSDFQKLFRVGYAFTIHACQGMSIETPYTIWEWERLNKKLKYVALSRAVRKEHILSLIHI